MHEYPHSERLVEVDCVFLLGSLEKKDHSTLFNSTVILYIVYTVGAPHNSIGTIN